MSDLTWSDQDIDKYYSWIFENDPSVYDEPCALPGCNIEHADPDEYWPCECRERYCSEDCLAKHHADGCSEHDRFLGYRRGDRT